MRHAVILAAVLLLAGASCAAKGRTTMTYDELKLALDDPKSGVVLFDVRTPEEYAEGHIPGARNIPVQDLGSRMGEVPKTGRVVVYCRSGNRSGRAQAMLEAAGYQDVVNFGAVGEWRGPLVR